MRDLLLGTTIPSYFSWLGLFPRFLVWFGFLKASFFCSSRNQSAGESGRRLKMKRAREDVHTDTQKRKPEVSSRGET